jgi:hypothetical protein
MEIKMSNKAFERLTAAAAALKTGETAIVRVTLADISELRRSRGLISRTEAGKVNRGGRGDHTPKEIKAFVNGFDAKRMSTQPLGVSRNPNGKFEIYSGNKRAAYGMDLLPEAVISIWGGQPVDLKICHYDQVEESYTASTDNKSTSLSGFLSDPAFAGHRILRDFYGEDMLPTIETNTRICRKLISFALAVDAAINSGLITVDQDEWVTSSIFTFKNIGDQDESSELTIKDTKDPIMTNKEYTKVITLAFGRWLLDVWRPQANIVAFEETSTTPNRKLFETFFKSNLGLHMIFMADFINDEKDKILFNPGNRKNRTDTALARSAALKLAGWLNNLTETKTFRDVMYLICSRPSSLVMPELLKKLKFYFGSKMGNLIRKVS